MTATYPLDLAQQEVQEAGLREEKALKVRKEHHYKKITIAKPLCVGLPHLGRVSRPLPKAGEPLLKA